jgi:dihydropteroate synthase
MINDVSASLWPVAADCGVAWVAMHMAGEPPTMQDDPRYDDVVAEVRDFLVARATAATQAGVPQVFIDPGFGFGKTARHNVELVASIGDLVATGFPVVLGASRKATLGLLATGSDRRAARLADIGTSRSAPTPTDDRLEPGVAMATWAMHAGVAMVRVHDVRAHVQAALVVAGSIPPAASAA